MLPVEENRPVAGSYSSALAREPLLYQGIPPVTSTLPFGSGVAVWPYRAVIMLPVGEKVPGCAAAGRGKLNMSTKMAPAPAQHGLLFLWVILIYASLVR